MRVFSYSGKDVQDESDKKLSCKSSWLRNKNKNHDFKIQAIFGTK